MDGLIIIISGITVENRFEVHYKIGDTPGDHLNGFTQYNGIFDPTNVINISGLEYGKHYWFKIVDTVNNSYIIENIKTHSLDYYQVECGEKLPVPNSNTIYVYVPNI